MSVLKPMKLAHKIPQEIDQFTIFSQALKYKNICTSVCETKAMNLKMKLGKDEPTLLLLLLLLLLLVL